MNCSTTKYERRAIFWPSICYFDWSVAGQSSNFEVTIVKTEEISAAGTFEDRGASLELYYCSYHFFYSLTKLKSVAILLCNSMTSVWRHVWLGTSYQVALGLGSRRAAVVASGVSKAGHILSMSTDDDKKEFCPNWTKERPAFVDFPSRGNFFFSRFTNIDGASVWVLERRSTTSSANTVFDIPNTFSYEGGRGPCRSQCRFDRIVDVLL